MTVILRPSSNRTPEYRSWMGCARAPRAVFRTLAETLERTKKYRVLGKRSRAQMLDAGRLQSYHFQFGIAL